MRIKLFDFVTVAVSLLAIGAASVFAYAGGEKNPTVVIEASETKWIYPLREDREVRVSGPLGEELIVIKSGEAYVQTSPCPNKLCILQGKISRPGQWIACLPNQVFLHVSGREENPVDGISY